MKFICYKKRLDKMYSPPPPFFILVRIRINILDPQTLNIIQGADNKLGQFLSQDIYATANHRIVCDTHWKAAHL